MTKPAIIRPLLLFCLPLLFFCCKKESAKKVVGPTCYDYMTVDSDMTISTAPYIQFYYYNTDHQLLKHVVYSGGDAAWSDTFAYDHGHVVKSWMSLDGAAGPTHFYTRNEYDYTDTLPTASRYYLGSTLIVHSSYTYDSKGRLATYQQTSDNTTLQTDGNYSRVLVYDSNDDLTELDDQYGNAVARYDNYDNKPNLNYRMPYDFAYDIFSYFNAFSKHNVGGQHFYNYNAYTNKTDTANHSFSYTYANGHTSAIIIDGSVMQRVRSLCR